MRKGQQRKPRRSRLTGAVSPTAVGGVRGLIWALATALIGVIVGWLGDLDAGELAPWVPLGVLALRTLEGKVDELLSGKVARDADLLGTREA